MNTDFINIYVERLLKEISDYVKIKLLLETQLQYLEKANSTLAEELEKYKKVEDKPSKKSQKVKEEATNDLSKESVAQF